MSGREPDWDELRTFLEVARDLSLSGAARRLGLAQPTVGRHIDRLEEALGATLFTRSPRGTHRHRGRERAGPARRSHGGSGGGARALRFFGDGG